MNITNRNLEELMMKKMIMALCIFICAFTLVACSGQQTNEPLILGVNAIITEIDKENKYEVSGKNLKDFLRPHHMNYPFLSH